MGKDREPDTRHEGEEDTTDILDGNMGEEKEYEAPEENRGNNQHERPGVYIMPKERKKKRWRVWNFIPKEPILSVKLQW